MTPTDGEVVSEDAVEMISSVKLAKVRKRRRESIRLYLIWKAKFRGKVCVCDNSRCKPMCLLETGTKPLY